MKLDKTVQRLVDGYGAWASDAALSNCPGGTGRMTKELYPYEAMFSPIKVNRTIVKNRLVMAPMGNIDMAEETGRPNDKMIQYFVARAKGGVGLITTGLIPISHGIDNSVTELGHLSYFPRIDRSRTAYAGWRDLAQGVHSFGAKIFVQLTAGLGRVGNPQCLINELKFPVSASMNPNFYIPQIPCMPLSDGQLKRIIKNAGQAAADAKAAGLDGVYLHGHEGYLLEQLTNPAFNRRKLGRYADVQRFGTDLIQEIRRRAGSDYPVMYRIDLSLALNETYGREMDEIPSLKKFKNGRTIDDTLAYMKNLVAAGVDMFDVDLGCYDNWWLPHPPAGMPAGCFLEIAEIAKNYLKENKILSNAGVEVPIVAVGKLGYPDMAEKALREGMADMIMLGRPLLADPEWPNKAYAGRVEEIRPCIGCQEGCINEFVDGGHPQCAVNPRTAFEHLYPEIPAKTALKKKIAVVGAGPAGIVTALTAAARGHEVELIEKGPAVGGRVIPGSRPRIKYDVDNYRLYLAREVEKAAATGEIKLRLNTALTAEELKAAGYDAIVFAVGTKNSVPPIPGIDKVNFVQAVDALMDDPRIEAKKKAVVIGAGVVGCETAYYLKYEKGMDVTVVEMLPYIMDGVCTANRGHLIYYLKRAGVALINCAKVMGFSEGRVKISRNVHKNVPNPYNTWSPILPKNIENPLAPKLGEELKEVELEADLVVLATGGRPDDALFFEAQKLHAAPELYNIGDSFHAGKVHEATRSAYALATKI